MKSFLLSVSTFAIWAATADAQPRIGIPILGYAFDSTVKSIRPISGVPGAAILGSPVDLGTAAEWSGVSPRQDYAVVVAAEDGAVRLVSLSAELTSQSLTAAFPSPALVAFSPSGAALALYRQDRRALQIFTHLPLHPLLSHEIDLTDVAVDTLSAAISDDGELALILAAGPESSAVWLSQSGTAPRPLNALPSITAMAFQGGNDRAALAARDGSVYLLENLSTAQSVRSISPPNDRTADPTAAGFSPEGERALVATSNGTVASFDIASAAAVFVYCGCRPSSLAPLNSRMLRLNEISDGTLMLLDSTDPRLRIWFVPALSPVTAAEGRNQ